MMRRAPDGVLSVNEPLDVSELLVVRTASLVSAATEEVSLPIPPSLYYKIVSILFTAPAIAGSTGHHVLTVFDKRISALNIPIISIAFHSINAITFNNVPLVSASHVSERLPATDDAIHAQVTNLILGTTSSNLLTLRYHNQSSLSQTGARNYLVIFKRVLPISTVRALG